MLEMGQKDGACDNTGQPHVIPLLQQGLERLNLEQPINKPAIYTLCLYTFLITPLPTSNSNCSKYLKCNYCKCTTTVRNRRRSVETHRISSLLLLHWESNLRQCFALPTVDFRNWRQKAKAFGRRLICLRKHYCNTTELKKQHRVWRQLLNEMCFLNIKVILFVPLFVVVAALLWRSYHRKANKGSCRIICPLIISESRKAK